MSKTTSGFTIVELLIVIVVIAILAAIAIVAYSGIQDRANYTKALSDLQAINKSLQVYNAQNGNYPIATSWRYYCSYQASPSNFIPGLTDVVGSVPPAPCTGATNTDDSWVYRSDATGANYKLLYIRANVSDGVRNMIPAEMRDTATTRWGAGTTWGYWTSDYAAT